MSRGERLLDPFVEEGGPLPCHLGGCDLHYSDLNKQVQHQDECKTLRTGEYWSLNAAVVRKHLNEAGTAAGIPQLHTHTLRHFRAKKLLKSGIDMRNLQIHLGHSSIQSTQMYIHLICSFLTYRMKHNTSIAVLGNPILS